MDGDAISPQRACVCTRCNCATSISYSLSCPLIQVVAGLRCRKNKTAVLLGMLMGRRWLPDELFTSEAGARPEANAILSNMTTFLQRSSNIANR